MPGPTGHSTRCRRRQRSQLPRLSLHSQSVHSEANDSLRLARSLPPQLKLCTLLSATTNLPTAARQNQKCTECGMTAFSRNQLSAESAHLSTFGAETANEAEIRSTSGIDYIDHCKNCTVCLYNKLECVCTVRVCAFTLFVKITSTATVDKSSQCQKNNRV